MSAVRFVQGNEACAEAALKAGLGFFAGYPITPSTEIAEILSATLPRAGGRFIQMEDEIASMCAIVGASLAGKKSMTATSGPGFSLMQEALGYAVMAEVPCVVASVMRGGPSTGLPTKVSQGDVNQARWGVHGDHAMIVLTASSVQDVFAMTVEAFNLSERYRSPVILLLDEIVGHMREKLVIPDAVEVEERLRTSVPAGEAYHPYQVDTDGRLPMSDYGDVHRYNVTGLFHDIHGFPTEKPEIVDRELRRLVSKIEDAAPAIAHHKELNIDGADTVLISYGSSARTAMEYALEARPSERVGVLELQTLWPFPKDLVRERAARAKRVVVVEMNMGQMADTVRAHVDDPGRVVLANRIDGTMVTPDDIRAALKKGGAL